jgi:hypothetical protein
MDQYFRDWKQGFVGIAADNYVKVYGLFFDDKMASCMCIFIRSQI